MTARYFAGMAGAVVVAAAVVAGPIVSLRGVAASLAAPPLLLETRRSTT
jgi:hypothetical protein